MGGERRESVYLKIWAPDLPTSLPDMCSQAPTASSPTTPLLLFAGIHPWGPRSDLPAG